MKRPLLLPLVPLYAAAQALQNTLRPAANHLTRPVISIGSLSAGGAGKTPVVIALATLLRSHGIEPAILTRGYGRTSTFPESVDPAGTPTRFGDEPLLMARLGLPVFVGADRHAAGRLAEAQLPTTAIHLPAVHLLDDGFQHRLLHRDLDIVLLTAEDVADTLLPAGNLREPLRALRRAHILILRDTEAASLTPFIRRHTQAPIWLIRRTLTLPAPPPSRPLVFSALARPESFFADLYAHAITPADTLTFPDHHPYSPADIARLRAAATRSQADAFLTTAKDAVKLIPPLRAALEQTAPLQIAHLTVTFLDEPTVWSHLAPHLP